MINTKHERMIHIGQEKDRFYPGKYTWKINTVYAAGAAIATVFDQAVSVVCALVILLKRNKAFRITREDLRINSRCRIALQIGLNGARTDNWTGQGSWRVI